MNRFEVVNNWVNSNIKKILDPEKDPKGKFIDIIVDIDEFQKFGDGDISNYHVVKILNNCIFSNRRLKIRAFIFENHKKIRIQKIDDVCKTDWVLLVVLVEEGLLKNGQKLYFYHHKTEEKYEKEYAIIDIAHSKLKETKFNRCLLLHGENSERGSPSSLAGRLRQELRYTEKITPTQGPKYWITNNGETLEQINDKARRMGL